MPLSKNARQENKGAKSLNFLARGKLRAQQDLQDHSNYVVMFYEPSQLKGLIASSNYT